MSNNAKKIDETASTLCQKNCPKCGKRAIKIDRDRFGRRHCECGWSWLPSKIQSWTPTKHEDKK